MSDLVLAIQQRRNAIVHRSEQLRAIHPFDVPANALIFPNDDAIVRLVGALLLEQNDEWAVQRARYMTLETISQMSDDPLVSLPAVAR